MSIPEDLIERAMSLPSEDRVALGEQLLASVPEVPEDRDPDWEEAWATELNRRQALIDSGQARWLTLEELTKEIHERRAKRLRGSC